MSRRELYLLGGSPALFEGDLLGDAGAVVQRGEPTVGVEGGRNNAAFRLALDLAARGVSQQQAVVQVQDAVGLGIGEVTTTVASAYRREGVRGRAAARPTVVRPPQHEVVEFWERCKPLDEQALEVLRRRPLDAERVAAMDLARVLPRRMPCPAWLVRHGVWLSYGDRRLVFPVYDSRFAMRSVRCRWLGTGSPKPKTVAPNGCSTKGLVLANAAARAMLPGGDVVIAEGEMDWLEWCLRAPHCAVIGIVAGAWTTAIANAVPAGSRVVVRTHDDDAGKKYRDKIVATLGRCDVWANTGGE